MVVDVDGDLSMHCSKRSEDREKRTGVSSSAVPDPVRSPPSGTCPDAHSGDAQSRLVHLDSSTIDWQQPTDISKAIHGKGP